LGVFGVRVRPGGIHGRALIDASVANGVSHLFTRLATVTGLSISPNNPTTVGNFVAKYNVEKHLGKEAAASAHGMTYTILRPVAFFENQTLD
jgi:hypothetical protein